MPGRLRLVGQVRLDANGNGVVTLTVRDFSTVTHTRVTVEPLPGQTQVVKRPRAVLYVQGDNHADTYSGHRDTDPAPYDLDPGDTIECQWTGGDAGALATLTVKGVTG